MEMMNPYNVLTDYISKVDQDNIRNLTIKPYTTQNSVRFIISINDCDRSLKKVYCTIQQIMTLYTTLSSYFACPGECSNVFENIKEIIINAPTSEYRMARIVTWQNMDDTLSLAIQTANHSGFFVYEDDRVIINLDIYRLDILYNGLEYIICTYGDLLNSVQKENKLCHV